MNRISMLKGAAAAITLAAVALPTLASAQSYDYRRYDNASSYGYGQTYDYRTCDQRQNDRQATGAVLGAAIGAIAGSQVSARGRRTENSVMGGLIGAVIGAGVGGDSANCYGQADRYDRRVYDQYGYDNRDYGYGYDGYNRDRRYDDRRYDDRYGAYDAYGYDQNGCRTVETRQRDRYGREVTRYEQVCRQGY